MPRAVKRSLHCAQAAQNVRDCYQLTLHAAKAIKCGNPQ
jgi:hypothetical protein